MTWNTVVVAIDRLAALLSSIRAGGGTITSSRPTGGGIAVTWVTSTR
jgi:hypothetical protein